MFAFLLLTANKSFGQTDTLSIRQKLITSSIGDSLLSQKVDLSVGSIPISELIRGIAKANQLNLVISPELNFNVGSNFKQIPVIDVITYLCQEYGLDIEIVGSIIKIFPARQKPVFNDPDIAWDADNKLLKCDLKGDSLLNVVKKISKITSTNILLPFELNHRKTWGYIDNQPIDLAIASIALINKLDVKRINENTFSMSELPDAHNQTGKGSVGYDVRGINIEDVNTKTARITAQARNASLDDIVTQIATRFNVGYVFSAKVEGNATFTVTNISFDELLNALFVGTNYAFKKENGVYIFGIRSNLEIFEVRRVRMQYRTIDNIEPIIPAALKSGVQITQVKELNSFVLSGSPTALDRIELFLKEIDQIVPLVYIEVLIVDIVKSKGVSTGISAGLGESTATTKGTVVSGVDLTLSSSSINKLIDGINGFGWLNLGKVTPQFYLSIKALEEKGNIRIRSTPKLSTLNGHEAVLTSGETKYYKEEITNWFGSQIPQQSKSYSWKSVNADLMVTITPVVSGDEQITMNIEVTQSEFTPREPADAPPGSINRSFKSLIRVRNEEMVLLGGLERNTSSDVSKGLPLIARIPVIRWFFSTIDKSESENKLTIFIKPIVIY
jgi:type IV pilus assembly protein PilQ